ncbi:hypothetical protein BX616_000459 [Lobosporangium transversale]|uniref:Methyltransferase FkbM domain-containing protein n=1 Tax=Lobosporangium transversale TaxID=64571 RepID=A0A1Y2GFF1_9FUNG|nr:hypothetical protein BCR41DRAFT_325996 [Lobosporangium transversale]KAF9907336.1 hypothetical protein BX616_000459 [Lobosporangium transversale]ORZ08484.1 hypothetical protein BCR41DRAFT_325996 [Lobosporangium transversale]|eukprot:XP_021878412.1 hypothetical protein BCR41DRAFT_325996 [Lobosporangium transversale]
MAVSNRSIIFPVALLLSALLLLGTYHRNNLQNGVVQTGQNVQAGQNDQNERRAGKPRYIFVDLGANRADSLDVFLKRPNTKFNYNFPRPEWANYEDAEIYLFEANPVFNEPLVKAKQHYDDLGIKVNIFPSTVVDVRDGIRTFYLDTVNAAHDYWGSSIYASHPDAVRSQSKGTDLTGINISGWLLRNTLPRDFVVVKMDIEGAEYEVIPHMADMGVWTVVDHLLVEWHGPNVGGGTTEEIQLRGARADAAKNKLIAEGINMPHYDSAA